MNCRLLVVLCLFFLNVNVFAIAVVSADSVRNESSANDSVAKKNVVIDLDFWLDSVVSKAVYVPKLLSDTLKISIDSIAVSTLMEDSVHQIMTDNIAEFDLSKYDVYSIVNGIESPRIDSLLLQSNYLFLDLVYKNPKIVFNWREKLLPYSLYSSSKPSSLQENVYKSVEHKSTEQILAELRGNALKRFVLEDPQFFVYRYDNLPGTEDLKSEFINRKSLSKLQMVDESKMKRPADSKLAIPKAVFGPWMHKANVLAQFSQNVVSSNWYQGGNSNMAVLGVLSGQLNYDNKKNLQFENNAEWRMGFYFVDDSTALRSINTNNDILKLNSKLGYKINGNWFYSGSVDFSTQLFNNFKAVNSNVLKASFLTPVRFNFGIGFDYKYKKMFSLAISPAAYKFIYINETDESIINPNLFGIEKGKNTLSELGSSMKAQLSYAPVREIQIDSKLSFYTNYEKVEVDWEIIGNFTINRYLSTRLSINPRYDNTVILAKGEKAKIQFKELLSFGFSYKLLN